MSDAELSQPKATDAEKKSDADRAAEAEQESAEFQLTPEIEAMVMEKVQDIDAPGTAYHSFVEGRNSDMTIGDRLESSLRNGLLPTIGSPKTSDDARALYAEKLKIYKSGENR